MRVPGNNTGPLLICDRSGQLRPAVVSVTSETRGAAERVAPRHVMESNPVRESQGN